MLTRFPLLNPYTISLQLKVIISGGFMNRRPDISIYVILKILWIQIVRRFRYFYNPKILILYFIICMQIL